MPLTVRGWRYWSRVRVECQNPDTACELVSRCLVPVYVICASVCVGTRMRDVREGHDPKCHWVILMFGR